MGFIRRKEEGNMVCMYIVNVVSSVVQSIELINTDFDGNI
jgi:hypothetical protein